MRGRCKYYLPPPLKRREIKGLRLTGAVRAVGAVYIAKSSIALCPVKKWRNKKKTQ